MIFLVINEWELDIIVALSWMIAISIVLGLIFLGARKYIENPFKYPYMHFEVDVSGKRLPRISDCVDEYLIENGMYVIDYHNKKADKWKESSLQKIKRSPFRKHRMKQYQSVLDDEHQFVLRLYRLHTRYHQINYVKHSYKKAVIVQQCGFNYQELSTRYKILKERNFESTIFEYTDRKEKILNLDDVHENNNEDNVYLKLDKDFPITSGNVAMNLEEYEKVKNLNYLQYCDYLQKKHGLGKYSYFSSSWVKNARCGRTNEGLLCHHKYEDHSIMLSDKVYAKNNPYEWQLPENLVYCDYLEHLYLHILICEYPSKDRNPHEAVGIGGIINFLVPELNDLYSGWKTKQQWRLNCHELVINNKDLYLVLLKRFKTNCRNYPFYTEDCLYTSFNESYGLWSKSNNQEIFEKIRKI